MNFITNVSLYRVTINDLFIYLVEAHLVISSKRSGNNKKILHLQMVFKNNLL
jgi:hypothetical protein